MRAFLTLALLAVVGVAQPPVDADAAVSEVVARAADDLDVPMPYSFEYSAADADGSHSHSSSSDGKTVTGQYSIMLADGRLRTVKYTADENGYRAEITTNELGTESKNPADVIIQSSAPTGAEAAQQGPAAPAAAAAVVGTVQPAPAAAVFPEGQAAVTAEAADVATPETPTAATLEPLAAVTPDTLAAAAATAEGPLAATERALEPAGEASYLDGVAFPPRYLNYRQYRAARFQ